MKKMRRTWSGSARGSISSSKDSIRRLMLKKRRSFYRHKKSLKKAFDRRILKALVDLPLIEKCTVISCYISKNDEVETRGFIRAVLKKKKKLAVPVIKGDFIYMSRIKSLKKFGALKTA